MEIQVPLIVFTLFVCLSCGLLAGLSFLTLKGEGESSRFALLLAAFASLVIGGIGSFLHLEHWERIFNGFGHITSGITQELIGVVVLGILFVVWFVVLRSEKKPSPILAWVSIVLAVAMVVATSHSYMMAARPAWGIGLLIFYLANAFLLGAIGLWAISVYKKDLAVEKLSVAATLFAAVVQLLANAIYIGIVSTASIRSFGYYFDSSQSTIAPKHIDSLLDVALTGEGSLWFWGAIVSMLVILVCAVLAKKKVGASFGFMGVAVVLTFVSSAFFRVLFYVLGFSIMVLY